ncbi:zinc finger CCCH domain-containing protein 44 [Gastrolobium bilobum]|uniref:zinc finger CCCH domain-containing protein 44 n=1 Tax=Gastrolobium bilobum TaxID=150636 RepID=UPI002AB1AC50|nr:zinc finger CCCH domain-containing protein 44 [Gastrolobium bilobum]
MEQPLQPETASSLGASERAAAEVLSRGVRDLEESRLVGAPVSLARDVDMAERDGGCNLEVTVVDGGAVLKRKRGRPAKGIPKMTPPLRQKKDEEDVCFICFDGGSLVLCDRRGCPKAYHPSCIKRDEAFFRSKAKWNCGWHICSSCQKASHYMCYTCTYSLCKGCTKDADFVSVRGNKGLCGICMRTIMLIENSAPGNKETCEVDFDDKSSWEYLFKVYWMYLKGKLSLKLDDLLRAKNPWKGDAPISCKVQTPHELYHLKDDKGSGSGSENSCIDIESNNLKSKKFKRQPQLLSKGDCFDRINSGGDSIVSLPECPKWASKELLEFVAHMKNGDTSLLSQFDVQTLLLEYVRENSLRDPQQKSQIVCDSRLVNLFGKARVGHIEMLKLLESHFVIKDNVPTVNTFGAGIIGAVASEREATDNYNKQLMLVNDTRCKTHKKDGVLVPQNNPDVYAAINVDNINLIYLRRSLMENLTEDTEKIHEKVVGSFVRIRISSSDQKQDMYRLVQVVGTVKVAEPYRIGTRMTDIKLEISNLNRKEVISIDEISNQEFSEDECKRLRQSIQYGFSKRLTVGEILEKALTLQAIRVNDLLEAEILRLNHLRDRANEKGHRKEHRECVEKLQLLNSLEERQRRLHEIPDVHSDPNLESLFESDEDAAESDESKQDDRCRTQDLPSTHEPIGNLCMIKDHINPNDTGIDDSSNLVVTSDVSSVPVDISSSLLSTGMELALHDSMNDKSWHYQDPAGKVQGPFSMLQLYKWNANGGFPPDLRIWRIDEKQDNSILLTDALSQKCSKNVSLPYNNQLLSLGASLTLDNKDNSQDDGRNATKNDISADSRIIEQSREHKVDDIATQSNGKDESVRSNGWLDLLHVNPSLPPTSFSEKLNGNPSDKLRKGHGIEGNSEDNGNYGSNRTSDGQSNSGNSHQKQSDSEEISGQSSGQNWKHPNVNSSSNCFVTTPSQVSGTKTSPHKLGFDLSCPPSPPPCITSTWQAIIGEPTDFDESVSDLLAEVEAMESLGGLESPTSIMKCGEELTDGSKNDCLSFADGLGPMLDAGKGDALSSTGDLHLPSQSTAAEEPLRLGDIHHNHQYHQRISGEHSSRSSEVKVGTKNVSFSGNRWVSGSENSPIVPSPATLGMAIDTTWRLGSENTHLGWGGMDQRNANTGWGVGQRAVQENRSSNSYTSAVTSGFGDSQTRHGSDRLSVPRDRGFHGYGRESGSGRGRTAWNRQPIFGVGNGGSYRPLPKGQRVCKFYESGCCKKGASCDYLHP